MKQIEEIIWKGKILAYIIRSTYSPKETTFITDTQAYIQSGFIVYPADHEIPKHIHRPILRRIDRTEEIIIVRNGKVSLSIYNLQKELVATRKLRKGDIVIFHSGGHGFRMLEDTILQEIKQGPYTGRDEKERF